MDKIIDIIAVGVGYYFSLVAREKINGISVVKRGYIKKGDKVYPYYRGQTYEDSRKIDKILDENEEFLEESYERLSEEEVNV